MLKERLPVSMVFLYGSAARGELHEGSDLDLVLETPSGQYIDPIAAASDPNIEFLTSPTLEFYRIRR